MALVPERLLTGPFWSFTGDTFLTITTPAPRKMKVFPSNGVMVFIDAMPGQHMFSIDQGASWSAGGFPTDCVSCYDVDIDASANKYWGLFVKGDGTLVVAYATNYATWTTAYTDSVRTGYNISVSDNGDVIAATAGSSTYGVIVSSDGGSAFSTADLDPAIGSGSANQPLIKVKEGRLMVLTDDTGSPYTYVSEDFGATWTANQILTGALGLDFISATPTGPYFLVLNGDSSFFIARSNDLGALEWFINPIDVDASAIAYDFLADELYVYYTDGEVLGLQHASEVDTVQANAATLRDIQSGISADGVQRQGVYYWVRYTKGSIPNGTRGIAATRKKHP